MHSMHKNPVQKELGGSKSGRAGGAIKLCLVSLVYQVHKKTEVL